MAVERLRFPFGDGADGEPDVQGWVVPVRTLIQAIAGLDDLDDGVWMSVRDKETGDYIDPGQFALFIHKGKKEEGVEERVLYCYYMGPPPEEDEDGWFNDFPPIPPGG